MSEIKEEGKHPAESIRDIILDEFQKGNIVIRTSEGLAKTSLKEFIKQPVEGMLYDLNRDEITVLTNIKADSKWINDFAVSKVIQELKSLMFKERPKEFIICAANYYNDDIKHEDQPANIETGFVICGRRHKNCVSIHPLSLEVASTETKGFITNTNRFVDRKEAYDIAFKADQIIGPNKGCPTNDIGLTSEDLY